MKHKLLLLVLLNLIFTPHLKSQFSPAIILENDQDYFTSLIKVADFNNDGLNDILTIADKFPLDVIKIYFNEGNNSFTPVIIDEQPNIATVDVGDLNDDSKIDFAIISDVGNDTSLSWYENQSGTFEKHAMGYVEPGMNVVLLRDFNNDEMTDILSLEHSHFVLRKAIAPGAFDEPEYFAPPNEYYAMNVNDYNNDGFLDVSIASATGFLVFINNSGSSFTHHSNGGAIFSFGLESADLDMDGDIDIVSYDNLQGLNLYKNDGSGNFTFDHTIIASSDNFKIFGLIDLNCDEIPDLHTVVSQQGLVIWMQNQGDAHFSSQNIVHDFDQLLYASASGDLNGDKIPDLIFGRNNLAIAINECDAMNLSDFNDNHFHVYPNPFGNEIYINSKSNSVGYTIQLMDLNGKSILSNNWVQKINTPDLPKGIYILNILNQKGEIIHHQKLIKR